MANSYKFGDYTYTDSPVLEGVKVGDEVEVTIKVTVTRVLPDQDVGGLQVKAKHCYLTLPTRIIKGVEVLKHGG